MPELAAGLICSPFLFAYVPVLLRPTLKMERLASARAEVRHASLVLRGYKRRRCAAICLTTWCELTALCIVAIAGCNFDLGVQWLLSKRRKGAAIPATVTATELRTHLEDEFLRRPVDELMSWGRPTNQYPAPKRDKNGVGLHAGAHLNFLGLTAKS